MAWNSLSRNDQLDTYSGDVDEWPHGFFIAGSSIKTINGVYIRRNIPRSLLAARPGSDVLIYYAHMSNASCLIMASDKKAPEAEEEDEEDEGEEDEEDDLYAAYYGHARRKPPKPEPVRYWYVVDEKGVDRFSHIGDTIVPGAGVRWAHVHRAAAGAPRAPAPFSFRTDAGGAQLARVDAPDDPEQLPWQVIAILDAAILNQLVQGAKYHEYHVAESVAGRGGAARAPALTSIEAAAAKGGAGWLYRVAVDTAVVRAAPAEAAGILGTRARGDYVRVVEVREPPAGGAWARLETPKAAGATDGDGEYEEEEEEDAEEGDEDDEDDDMGADAARRDPWAYAFGGGGGRGYFNAAHRRPKPAEWWTLLAPAGAPPDAAALLTRVDAADVAGLATSVEGESKEDDAAPLTPAAAGAGGAGAGGPPPPPPRRLESLAAEFLDAPFVPRLDGAGAGGAGGATTPAAAAAEAGAAAAAAAARADAERELPVGAEVVIARLVGADTRQYNGVTGVVVTPLGADGRQGVRLDAPFAGKRLNARPANIAPPRPGAAGVGGRAEAVPPALEPLARAARTLGLTLRELGIIPPTPAPAPPAPAPAAVEGAAAPPAPPAAASPPPAFDATGPAHGFRIGGAPARAALAAAARAAARDCAHDEAGAAAAAAAAAALEAALPRAGGAGGAGGEGAAAAGGDAAAEAAPSASPAAPAPPPAPAAAPVAFPPDTLVRHGALGARAAAAARAAVSVTSAREAESGAAALKDVLLDELDRAAGAGEGEAESSDALRLRLAIALAHLAAGRDAAALAAAAEAAAAHAREPAAAFVHARALLRAGRRTEALAALARAAGTAAGTAVPDGAGGAGAGAGAGAAPSPATPPAAPPAAPVDADAQPESAWARAAGAAALAALASAERLQRASADAYDRGAFLDAAALYRAALRVVEAGARDDRASRAALHANVAACLRRARDAAGAVEACDAALALLPRFSRALFRRAVCLLEAGRPADAVDAFEALYRVDRAWPKLSEWLVRAVAAARRAKAAAAAAAAAGGGAAASPAAAAAAASAGGRGPKRSREGGGGDAASPASPGGGGASPGGEGDDDDDVTRLAAERDHYVVLGVTVDATEKQVKAAYRTQSLRYHPDRAGPSRTAAFQRVAAAFAVLSDAEKRAAYDAGADVKATRKGKREGEEDDEDEEEAEEHKQTLREEIERKFWPERYEYWPFGDPFVAKRKLAAQKERAAKEAAARAGGGGGGGGGAGGRAWHSHAPGPDDDD